MIGRGRRALLLVVAAALASGCFTMRAQLPGALRVDLEDEEVVVGGRFDIEVSRLYLFWGLVPVADESDLAAAMQEAAAREGVDGVANLTFESRFSGMDFALQMLTLGIVAPRTYRVRGDLVRINAPPLPGSPLLRPRQKRGRERPSQLPPSRVKEAS